jgi:GntR family galactonate operon transcriptional repressor
MSQRHAAIDPLGHRNVHTTLLQFVGRRIASDELGEGDTIDPAALQDELNVSRTSVREAIRVLGAKGLVEARQKRGTVVLPATAWNLLDPDVLLWAIEGDYSTGLLADLQEVREIIEPSAAALAASRRSEEHLEAMEAALQAMSAAVTTEEAVAADLDLHRAIYEASGNKLLIRMAGLVEQAHAARDFLVHSFGETNDPIPVHRALVAAVRAGLQDETRRISLLLLSEASAGVSSLEGRR